MRKIPLLILGVIIIVVSAGYAETKTSEATLIGEWNIVVIYSLDSDNTVSKIDDADGIFVFMKSGFGTVVNKQTGENLNFTWRINADTQALTLTAEDYQNKGYCIVMGSTLVMTMIQNGSSSNVIVMERAGK